MINNEHEQGPMNIKILQSQDSSQADEQKLNTFGGAGTKGLHVTSFTVSFVII